MKEIQAELRITKNERKYSFDGMVELKPVSSRGSHNLLLAKELIVEVNTANVFRVRDQSVHCLVQCHLLSDVFALAEMAQAELTRLLDEAVRVRQIETALEKSALAAP